MPMSVATIGPETGRAVAYAVIVVSTDIAASRGLVSANTAAAEVRGEYNATADEDEGAREEAGATIPAV